MEQFELVEKLVSTFGVSYEKAKEALEASRWNAVDAAVYLEKERQAGGSTSQDKSGEQSREYEKRNTKGSCFNIPVDEMKNAGNDFFKTCWDFLSLNTVVIKKSSGEKFLEIPIWLAMILVCVSFWTIFLVVGVLFVMGYRFSFNGPQLGRERVKSAMDQAENTAKDFVKKVKNAVSPDDCEPVESQPEIVVDQVSEEEKKEENSSEE